MLESDPTKDLLEVFESFAEKIKIVQKDFGMGGSSSSRARKSQSGLITPRAAAPLMTPRGMLPGTPRAPPPPTPSRGAPRPGEHPSTDPACNFIGDDGVPTVKHVSMLRDFIRSFTAFKRAVPSTGEQRRRVSVAGVVGTAFPDGDAKRLSSLPEERLSKMEVVDEGARRSNL